MGTSWSLGRLLFSRLKICLLPGERKLLESITGAALLSLAIFLLCCIGLARAEVFLLFGAACIALAVRARQEPAGVRPRAKISPGMLALFWGAFVLYAALYLSNSLAPEISPDGVAYHLGLVARYYRQHGFQRLTTNMYGNLTQGVELLFLYAFAFGRHSSAATVHCCFLLASPFLIRRFGERMGRSRAGLCGGLLFFLSPLVGVDGVSAYNDVALAVVAFAMYYLLEIWRGEDQNGLLIPIGLLAGFCFAIKYTGFIAVFYSATVILLRRRPKALLPVGLAAATIAIPWLVKNWITVGDPVSPFLSKIFRNAYIHVSFEQDYTAYFRTYDLPSLKPLFWFVTVDGRLGGLLGPVFLLTPLLLLQLRTAAGRSCLLALLFFLIPYPNNIGARFLLPAAPFAAFGIGLAVDFAALPSMLLVLLAGVLAWPKIIPRYSASGGGWHIESMPWKQALWIRDSDAYLFTRIPHILIARELDEKVGEGERVWSSTPVAEAYTKRDVIVNYQSAEGQQIQDILFCAHFDDLSPTWNQRMTFPARTFRKLRIRQTAESRTDIWSIGELRVFLGVREIVPSQNWKMNANPNPWNAALAFDRNPATRWKTWESIQPWMYFDVDFGAPLQMDRIELHSSHDQFKIDLRAESCELESCSPVPVRLVKLDDPPLGDLRREATKAIRARGVRYLLIEHEDALAGDIYPDPSRWGLRLLSDRNRTRLYEIQ